MTDQPTTVVLLMLCHDEAANTSNLLVLLHATKDVTPDPGMTLPHCWLWVPPQGSLTVWFLSGR